MKFSENPSCRNISFDDFKEFTFYTFSLLFILSLITLISLTVPSFVAEQIYKGCSSVASGQKEQHKIILVKQCRKNCTPTLETHKGYWRMLAAL